MKCKDVIKELGTCNWSTWCAAVSCSCLYPILGTLRLITGRKQLSQGAFFILFFLQWQISVMTLYLMAFISVVRYTSLVQLKSFILNSCWNSIFQCPAVIGDGVEIVATRDVISENWWVERKMYIWADGQDMGEKNMKYTISS